jgi:hypothetical protein
MGAGYGAGFGLVMDTDAINKGRAHVPVAGLKKNFLPGELNSCAKLTAEQVREMRRLRAEGMTLAALALRYPVTVATIHEIVKRRQWKHII